MGKIYQHQTCQSLLQRVEDGSNDIQLTVFKKHAEVKNISRTCILRPGCFFRCVLWQDSRRIFPLSNTSGEAQERCNFFVGFMLNQLKNDVTLLNSLSFQPKLGCLLLWSLTLEHTTPWVACDRLAGEENPTLIKMGKYAGSFFLQEDSP